MTTKTKEVGQEKLRVVKPLEPSHEFIMSDEALQFLVEVVDKFTPAIDALLQRRKERQKIIDSGQLPTFPEETKEIRDSEWQVSQLPPDLFDRKVEITGPVDRKMIINALNSGANVFMADFEDSNSPTWRNIINGQINLYDAVRRTIDYTKPDGSKHYSLNEEIATLMVRPRGFHLVEEGIYYQGKPVYGALVDFSLYFFHNAKFLLKNGSGPYFYLPKLQHYTEARVWNDIFEFAQDYLEVPRGMIKATVLLEHILAAFQMDEILYELRDHSAGLNCGRWDYIFSFIKTFSTREDFVLPDRSEVTMDRHFLRSYVTKLIMTCHRRGVHAMGGMAAQIPIKGDQERNQRALEKIRQDKLREVEAGHDGTWVAHPGLIPIAKQAFEEGIDGKNQLEVIPEAKIEAIDLLKVPDGHITEDGVRININVGMKYLASWLCGNGCVPIYHLMEDAATAEISRSQLWQWLHHQVQLASGKEFTEEIFLQILEEEATKIEQEIGSEQYEKQRFDLAEKLFRELTLKSQIPEFLTLQAYPHLEQEETQ